jgi:hypothetical protein
MAAVYKVGKKWRADWTDLEGIRHRRRFDTKGEADAELTEVKTQLNAGTYVAPKKIPTFVALADEWMTGRIEESRKPGEGYRPSILSQWQTHIAHMRTGFDLIKLSDIDARAIERAITKWRLSKKDGGRGLSQRTAAKVRTTMSRIFRFGINSKRGIVADPTKFIEKPRKARANRAKRASGSIPGYMKSERPKY